MRDSNESVAALHLIKVPLMFLKFLVQMVDSLGEYSDTQHYDAAHSHLLSTVST